MKRPKEVKIMGVSGDIFILVAFFVFMLVVAHMRHAANTTYTGGSGQTSHINEGVYDVNELTGRYTNTWAR